jgi:hypothetical protein
MLTEGNHEKTVAISFDETGLPRNSDAETLQRKISQAVTVRYYDVARHWTKRIEPHLQDETLNKILIADFNDYTQGRWGVVFYPGTYPENIESWDWPVRPSRQTAEILEICQTRCLSLDSQFLLTPSQSGRAAQKMAHPHE